MNDNLAFPLTWPEGWPRTSLHQRDRGSFKGTLDMIRRELVVEVNRIALGSSARTQCLSYVLISTNLPLRNDGYPRANAPDPTDPGVAVYFKRKGKDVVFACDKYDKVWKNMRAISKTIEALRGVERWGSSQLLDRAFTGFARLAEKTQESCWEVLGIPPSSNEQQIMDAYRRKAREAHPDTGGSPEAFDLVVKAKDMALQLSKQ
jgi:hypothetical protein